MPTSCWKVQHLIPGDRVLSTDGTFNTLLRIRRTLESVYKRSVPATYRLLWRTETGCKFTEDLDGDFCVNVETSE